MDIRPHDPKIPLAQYHDPMNEPPHCLRCDEPMQEGFVVDYGDNNWRRQANWVPGAPQATWLGAVKAKNAIPITTWRCAACGMLESYANPGTP